MEGGGWRGREVRAGVTGVCRKVMFGSASFVCIKVELSDVRRCIRGKQEKFLLLSPAGLGQIKKNLN